MYWQLVLSMRYRNANGNFASLEIVVDNSSLEKSRILRGRETILADRCISLYVSPLAAF
jgi:hypothetical protein